MDSHYTLPVRIFAASVVDGRLQVAEGGSRLAVWDLRAMCDTSQLQYFLQNLVQWTSDTSCMQFFVKHGRRVLACAPVLEPVLALGDDAPLASLEEHSLVGVAAHARMDTFSERAVSNFLTPQLQKVVQCMIDKEIYAEKGRFMNVWDFPDGVDETSLQRLIAINVVEAMQDEFDFMSYSLRLSSLRLQCSFRLVSPSLSLTFPCRGGPSGGLSKLELLAELLRIGFKVRLSADVDCLAKGAALELPDTALDMAKSFLQCMLENERIFKKRGGLNAIFFRGTDSYYKSLLSLGDLSAVAGLVNVYALTDDDFKDIIQSQAPEIEDKSRRTDKDKRRDQALKERKESRAVISPLAIEDVLEAPPIVMTLPGLDQSFTACFDRFVHTSGNRRTFCYCPLVHVGVRRCRRYRFLKQYNGNFREAAIHAAAWVYAGLTRVIPDDETHALNVEPSAASPPPQIVIKPNLRAPHSLVGFTCRRSPLM